MTYHFIKLFEPTAEIAEVFTKWDNDPALVHLIRPNQNSSDLNRPTTVTVESLTERLEDFHIYLVYFNDQLVGEMNYIVDPGHLYKKVPGTAWIGITIGEDIGRDKGIGYAAIQYLEDQIKKQGLTRIELGVFEFNKRAHKLYEKLGYEEIGIIDNFTYWQGEMWTDIRMDKYL